MKEKRLEMAKGLLLDINIKRGNLNNATAFIESVANRDRIQINPSGCIRPSFILPARLAKDVLGVMHTLLVQDLKAAEEVFKRL